MDSNNKLFLENKTIVELKELISSNQKNQPYFIDDTPLSEVPLIKESDVEKMNSNINSLHSEIIHLIHSIESTFNDQTSLSEEEQFFSSQIILGIELIIDIIDMFTDYSSKTELASFEGNAMLLSLKEQIENVSKSILYSKKITENLSTKSLEIEKMLTVIVDVSSKINLLSLNASIEPACAGEQGKGFKVVADEVKKLASQTKDSSIQIS